MTGPDAPTLPRALPRALARAAFACAVVALGIGAFSLATWAVGDWAVLALGTGYVPTAPLTAIFVMLLASSIGLDAAPPRFPAQPAVARGLAFFVAAAMVLVIGASLAGFDPFIERWLFPWDIRTDGIRVGRMSVYTASLLLVIATSRAVRTIGARGSRLAVGGTLTGLLASSLILQAYLLGGPLTYGTGRIPVAALTAACLVLLGAASLLTLGPECWPLRVFLAPRPTAPPSARGFRALALMLALFVAASGFFWYRGADQRTEQQHRRALRDVAEAMAAHVGTWYANQVTTARAAGHLAARSAALGSPAARGAPGAPVLETLRSAFGYQTIALWDVTGRLLAFETDGGAADTVALRERVRALAAPGTADLVVDGVVAADTTLPFSVWVRLPRASGTSTPTRWLLLRTDSKRTLGAIVRDMPLEERTAEVGVFARDGDHGVALHALLKRPDAALRLRLPLDPASDVPGIRGLLGDYGIFDARDYAGDRVTAAVRPVPGAPWVVVAKIDRAELTVPVRALAVRATLVSLLLIIGAAALAWALWYRRDLSWVGHELALLQERDKSLEELRRSEDRYARAIRGALDGVWDWELASGSFYISPQWRERFGVSGEGPWDINTAFFERMHAEDVPLVRERLRQHFEEGVPYDIELRLHDDAGEYHWLWSRGEAERDAHGRVVRMAGSVTDITERRAADAALRRLDRVRRMRSAANQALARTPSEADLLQAVCDVAVHVGGYRMAWVGYAQLDEAHSVRPMAWSGEERGYLAANPVAWDESTRGAGPTGRAIRTGEAQPAQDLLSERGYEPWREAARERGFASSISIPIIVDSAPIGALMLYSSEAFAFDADEVALLTEIGNDLSFGVATQRNRRALEAQRSDLQLFREVMERSPDTIFLTDEETGRYIDFNGTACRELGYTPEELFALGPEQVAPGISEAGGWSALTRTLKDDAPTIALSQHRRKDGTLVPVEVSRTRIRAGGRNIILAVARDVSERARADAERAGLQMQLLRSQRMESVGRLAGGIAHDFNNLLTVINANADLVGSDLPPGSPVAADVLQIRTAGARAATLTRQLLAFSRQSVMRREVLDINTLLTGFLGMLKRVIGEDIKVDAKLSARECRVHADPGQLEQVLMNLCVNARDAMPRGGTLTLETQLVDVDVEYAARHETMRPGQHVQINVSDTGEGMSREVQTHMFEPFFTTKESGKGTGLGLATVYGIVKQTGGSIWVYSEVGRGTTFKIFLPVHEGALSEAAPEPAAPPRGHEAILVVEDDPTIRHVARRILERGGYTVQTAGSGQEALDLFAAHGARVALVLTDLVMPGMSGIELARTLREQHPHVRLLLTSGYSAEALAKQVDSEPGLPLISKPYSVKDLLEAVRRILDESR